MTRFDFTPHNDAFVSDALYMKALQEHIKRSDDNFHANGNPEGSDAGLLSPESHYYDDGNDENYLVF